MGTIPRLTVCGAGAAGMAIAADNALKGLEVAFFELHSLAAKLTAAREARGIEVTADSETTAGQTGFAKLAGITSDPAEAVADADVIMITVPAMHHDAFMDAVAPHLKAGQIVLFTPAIGPRCDRHGVWATVSLTSPWQNPTSCRTSASRAATRSTSGASSGTSVWLPSPAIVASRCSTS